MIHINQRIKCDSSDQVTQTAHRVLLNLPVFGSSKRKKDSEINI